MFEDMSVQDVIRILSSMKDAQHKKDVEAQEGAHRYCHSSEFVALDTAITWIKLFLD